MANVDGLANYELIDQIILDPIWGEIKLTWFSIVDLIADLWGPITTVVVGPMIEQCKAAEQYSLDEALAHLPVAEAHAHSLLSRLNHMGLLSPDAEILDIGAAQGRFLIAAAKMGYRAVGLEPWSPALGVAERLAEREGVHVAIVPGVAEQLPFDDGRFDMVHAMSVMEHVTDAQAAANEAHRVLKRGGVFWFYSTNSLCPRQAEIRGFPCFGWYPDRLKRRIMLWSKEQRPDLVGNTQAPALNWFTPAKAHRMLRQAGFRRVYDRWDVPPLPSASSIKRLVFRMIGSTAATRVLAAVFSQGNSFAAVK